MSLEIYAFPPSPRAFKVIALAYHLDIPFTLKVLDFRKGDHRTPGYVAINPNMRMPAIKDGEDTLWESEAILHWLAAKRPQSDIVPKDERARIDMLRWQFWSLAHWEASIAPILYEKLVKKLTDPAAQPDMTVVAKSEETFHGFANVLEGQLQKSSYVAGGGLTLADFSLGSDLIYAEMAQLPLASYPNIRRWYAQLAALPAWQRALKEALAQLQSAA